MIKYKSDVFGLKTLLIWHGSAVFRALLPATCSTCFMFLLKRYMNGSFWEDPENILEAREFKVVQEPYTITVFIAFFSFLLASRLNYSYQRVRYVSYSVFRCRSSLQDDGCGEGEGSINSTWSHLLLVLGRITCLVCMLHMLLRGRRPSLQVVLGSVYQCPHNAQVRR
jgi:hypothetical protein